MDPQLCCFVMCDDVRAVNGKHSMVGIFYRIHVKNFPGRYSCYLVVGWYGENGQHIFEMNLTGPGGEKLQKLPPCSFSLTPSRPYYNAVTNIELTLPHAGIYHFEIFVNSKLCGHFPLHVESVQ